MAKKKKLNQRAVAVLIAIGAVMVLGLAVWTSKYWLHRDPGIYAAEANAAFAAGNYEDAERLYAIAASADDPVHLYQLANTRMQVLRSRRLTPTEQREKFNAIREGLRRAVLLDPSYAEPQRMLCDMYWGFFMAGAPARDFLAEADKLLRIDPNDHSTLFRRGTAKARESTSEETVDQTLAESALADYRQAAELKPDDLNCWRAQVSFLIRIGRKAEVAPTYERALNLEPNSVVLRTDYAAYLRSEDRMEDALRQIDETIRRQPTDVLGYLARAGHMLAAKDFREANQALASAKGIDDSDYRIYQQMADLLLRQNDANGALQSIREGLGKVSDRLAKETDSMEVRRLDEAAWQMNGHLALLLVDLRLRQRPQGPGDLDEAQRCLEAMDKLAPEHPGRSKVAGLIAYVQGDAAKCVPLLEQAVNEPGGADPATAQILVELLKRMDQPTRALQILEGLSRLPGQRNPAALALMMADLKMMTRDYRGADVEIARALQASPGLPQAWNLKYILQVLMGDNATLPETVSLSPVHVNMLLDRVAQLGSERRGREALGLLEVLHRRSPDNRQVVLWLLDAYLSGAREDLAVAMQKDAQASDPSLAAWIGEELDIRKQRDPNQRYALRHARLERQSGDAIVGAQKELELARIAAQEGLAGEARKHMEAAAQMDPNHPRVVERFFILSLQEKDWKEAENWSRRAAAVNADAMDGYWYAARLAIEQRQIPQAIENLQKVLRRQPDFRVGQMMLADCYRVNNESEKAQGLYEAALSADASYFPAVKGMALLTAGKPAEHERWVEQAARLPQGRNDDYVQQESVKLLERRSDPNSIPRLIEGRRKVYGLNPGDLENVYYLGVLYEQASGIASSEGRSAEAEQRLADAEKMFRAVFDKVSSKLDGARPLAEFYGRNDRIGDLTSLLGDLGRLNVDPVGLQVLAGDALMMLDVPKAEAAYKQALEKAPRNPRGHFAIARFYQRLGRWPEAVRAFQKYQELVPPEDQSARFWVIQAQIQAGGLSEAGRALAGVLAKEPTNAKALGLLGILAMKQRQYDEAEKAFDASLQGDPQDIGVMLGRARLYVIRGQPQKARRDLQSVRLSVGDFGVSMEYAQVCQFLGDWRGAEAAYREILSRQRDYAPAMRALAELYLSQGNWAMLDPLLAEAKRRFPSEPSYLLVEARAWKARKESQKSLEAMRAAAAMAPDSANVLSEYLISLLEEQQYEKAAAEANQLAAKPPMTAVALAVKGRALVRLGRGPEAEASFQASLTAEPSVPQAVFVAQQASRAYPSPAAACQAAARWVRDGNLPNPLTKVFLGCLYSEAKDLRTAAGWLSEAYSELDANAGKAAAGFLLGLTQYQARDYPLAERTFLEVLRSAPDEMQVLNNLAFLYANDLQDGNRALPYARRALELAPGNSNVVDTYGWVLIQLKRYDEGIEALSRAVAINPSGAIFRHHLGYAYEQKGRLDEASRQYEEGLRVCAAEDESTRGELQKAAQRVRRNP